MGSIGIKTRLDVSGGCSCCVGSWQIKIIKKSMLCFIAAEAKLILLKQSCSLAFICKHHVPINVSSNNWHSNVSSLEFEHQHRTSTAQQQNSTFFLALYQCHNYLQIL